ncbi:MAG: hypothetical protein ACRCV9_04045 [Burkholderiaceae bacterium]
MMVLDGRVSGALGGSKEGLPTGGLDCPQVANELPTEFYNRRLKSRLVPPVLAGAPPDFQDTARKANAHRMLDKVAAGLFVSDKVIVDALIILGERPYSDAELRELD